MSQSDLLQGVFQRSDEQELGMDAERRHVAGDLLAVAVQPVPGREGQNMFGRHHRRPGARGGQGGAPGPRRDALRVARVPEKFTVGQLKLKLEIYLLVCSTTPRFYFPWFCPLKARRAYTAHYFY